MYTFATTYSVYIYIYISAIFPRKLFIRSLIIRASPTVRKPLRLPSSVPNIMAFTSGTTIEHETKYGRSSGLSTGIPGTVFYTIYRVRVFRPFSFLSKIKAS